MINRAVITCLLVLVITGPCELRAESLLDLSGHLQLDKRFLVEKEGVPQVPMFQLLFLELRGAPSDNLQLLISSQLRYYDFTITDNSADLSDPNKSFPLDLLLWEAWLELTDLFFEGLDLKMGKQRISWGTADGFNPTDNLNPYDFSDSVNFGEKIPAWALKLDLILLDGDLTFTGVFMPGPRPVLLPRYTDVPFMAASSLDMAGMAGELPPGMTIGTTSDSLRSPPFDLKHTMQAFKVAGYLLTVDWSLSYFHGYDSLPVIKQATTAINPDNPTEIDVKLESGYLEYHIAGVDLAWELFTLGWWVEGAIYFPEKVSMIIIDPQGAEQEEEILDGEPFFKIAAGFDYTFTWGTYINFQYVHGFITERGRDELKDYFILRLEENFLEDTLKLSLVGLFETDGFKNLSDHYGFAIAPEITWKPFDNIDIIIGYFALFGGGDSLFSLMGDEDQAYLKLKASF